MSLRIIDNSDIPWWKSERWIITLIVIIAIQIPFSNYIRTEQSFTWYVDVLIIIISMNFFGEAVYRVLEYFKIGITANETYALEEKRKLEAQK